MNITILIGAFLPCPPIQGGAVEKMWFELAKAFVSKGHKVNIISKKWEGLVDGYDEFGINHIRINGFDAPSNIALRLIKDFFYTLNSMHDISDDTDIIVTNTFWAPIIAKKRFRKKIYVDVARVPKGQLGLYKGVGRLRANSTPVYNAIINEIDSREQVVCIPNPLPFKLTGINDIEQKSNTILFVGRIHPEKGLDLLIESFKKLDNKNWTLKIIGPHSISDGGGGDIYLQQLFTKIGSITNIEITGPIYEKQKLIDEYNRSKIFVYPSLAEKGETFGLAPLEAMACGSVPIVSDLDCFKDFIHDRVNGMFFDHRAKNKIDSLKEKLEYLTSTDYVLNNFRNNCIDVNKTHSTDAIADKFLEDFSKIKNGVKF